MAHPDTSGEGGRPPASERGTLLWAVLLNAILVAAFVVGAIPLPLVTTFDDHDYGGTLLVVAWLFGFWIFVQRWILVADPPLEFAEAQL